MKMLGYYRKKPVTVQAWQIVVGAVAPGWVQDALQDSVIIPTARGDRWGSEVTIKTNGGDLLAHPGDWIIKAEDGTIWSQGPVWFAGNYEAVPDV